MNETHWCEDKDTLVAYLYGELDADGCRVFEGHLRTCTPCAREIEGLQGVRSELAEWAPPEMELGFAVIQARAAQPPPATVLRPSRWSVSAMPAWARAAAAVFLVGVGLGFANLEVRSDANGFSVSTGWMGPAPQSAPAPAATAPAMAVSLGGPETPAWREEMATLEADLRKEIQAMHASEASVVPTSTSPATVDGPAVLRRVQTLIAESERRQEQELARRLSQFGRESEMQRRADLVRLEQGFGRVEAQRGVDSVRQQQMLDYLYRVSTSKVP